MRFPILLIGIVITVFLTPACQKTKRMMSINLIDELPRASIQAKREEHVDDRKLGLRGESRRVLFMHAPSRVEFDLLMPAKAKLTFGAGMPQFIWNKQGDGVHFTVEIDDATDENAVLYSAYVNPKAVEADRRWHDVELDLAGYEGQRVKLIFATDPGPAGNFTLDLAGFSNPTLTGFEW